MPLRPAVAEAELQMELQKGRQHVFQSVAASHHPKTVSFHCMPCPILGSLLMGVADVESEDLGFAWLCPNASKTDREQEDAQEAALATDLIRSLTLCLIQVAGRLS